MSRYGDDKALSLGGSLPGEMLNGLPSVYDKFRKTGGPVFVVAVLVTDYVKVYPNGNQPDEPVLKLTRVEVAAGDDEATVMQIMDRLQSARNGDQTPSLAQGALGD